MEKLPPIEKIYEAYTAIADGRVLMGNHQASVASSDQSKAYLVTWLGNTYSSTDNATYWQGYAGYPVIAVMMLNGVLPYDEAAGSALAGIQWKVINTKHKNNYAAAFEEATASMEPEKKQQLISAAGNAFDCLRKLDIEVKRGKRKK